MALKFIGGGKMLIGVDAGCLGIKDKRLQLGVYQMAFNLFRQLARIDNKNRYHLYSFLPIKKEILCQFGSKMKNVVVKPSFGWNHLALPMRIVLEKPDVFLGLSQSLPFFCPCPKVVVVHDLAFEYLPKLKKITSFAVQKADKIIAVSKSTKNDLEEIYKMQPEKIKVAYEGYDKNIFKYVRCKKENYFLYVGAFKKIKNIPGLIQGFKYFLKKSGLNFQLFLVGSDFRKLKLEKRIKIKGFVSREKLPELYQKAFAFVSPSFYEGFGLPLLEAAACGCPVIAGKNGAAKEIIGKTGILVEPKDSKAIGEAMLQVVKDKILRQKMIREDLKQAKLFSWEKFARNVLKVINQ